MRIIKFMKTPDKGHIKAKFSVEFQKDVIVKGFKIIDIGKGPFLGLPYIPGKGDKRFFIIDLDKTVADEILKFALHLFDTGGYSTGYLVNNDIKMNRDDFEISPGERNCRSKFSVTLQEGAILKSLKIIDGPKGTYLALPYLERIFSVNLIPTKRFYLVDIPDEIKDGLSTAAFKLYMEKVKEKESD